MDFRPKKRFGQNFLRDLQVVARILEAAGLAAEDRVLEIGPGLGVLTDRILPQVAQMTVMEVDRELAERMRQRGEEKLRVVEGDALRLDWSEILGEPPYKLVANLPYNISSQVLFKILDHRLLFSRLVLMFQKEVGERLAAAPGGKDYGILSVLCQARFRIRRVTAVPPGAFIPAPKVDSIVLALDAHAVPPVAIDDEALFRRVVKAAFAQRRKTLRNTLAAGGFGGPGLEPALAAAGIDSGRRGETLSLQEFARLAAVLADCC